MCITFKNLLRCKIALDFRLSAGYTNIPSEVFGTEQEQTTEVLLHDLWDQCTRKCNRLLSVLSSRSLATMEDVGVLTVFSAVFPQF